jgi:hypothetical protein
MTHQINLYAREVEERRGPLLITAFGYLAFAALLLLYWHVLRTQTETLEARVKQTSRQLENERAAMKTMKDALAQRTDPARVAAELAALKSRAAEAQDLVDRVQKGELGTLDGFSGHLTALATIGEPGVWITGVRIQNAGRAIEVAGNSLRPEAVLRYATEVNKQITPLGASITALEMTPTVNKDKATAVAFKLN